MIKYLSNNNIYTIYYDVYNTMYALLQIKLSLKNRIIIDYVESF